MSSYVSGMKSTSISASKLIEPRKQGKHTRVALKERFAKSVKVKVSIKDTATEFNDI